MNIIYLVMALRLAAQAHDHGAPEPGRAGAGRGVLEASEEKGLRLSPEAKARFTLEEKILAGAGPWRLPRSALVSSGNEAGVFRLRGGFYRRVEIEPRDLGPGEFTVASPELKAGDSVVVKNAGFLRVAEIATFGAEPAGHAH